ncbi:CHAP domain-containing protein [Nonomuraea sp. NPDC050022]|uniref:CHAP domain-containing protein n=1 Tax=Nonomuraea sp. NPDC050022 TaxID=3364358 RepID=UPI0037B10666
MRGEVGYREKGGQLTKFGQWYADRVKDPQYRDAPWCDMFIAWAADKAGVGDYVGQFAWTPSHASWFMKQRAWSQQPEPGALVFFDWGGGKSYKGIDHVGIVERVDGKKIHTIEANVDRVWLKRKSRDTDKVVGYGLPRMVKANATLNEIRTTEQPLARQPEPVSQGSPMDVLGSPLALLTMMVLTTVVVSFRLAGRRRGSHTKVETRAAVGKPETRAAAVAKKAVGEKAVAKKAVGEKAAGKKAVGKKTRSASYAEAPPEPVRVGGPPDLDATPAPARTLVAAHRSTTRRNPYERP